MFSNFKKILFIISNWLEPCIREQISIQRASQVAIVVRNLTASAGDLRDLGLNPGWGRSLGGGHGNPLQYSCLENPMEELTGRLQSLGLHRVGHNWMDLACTHAHVYKSKTELPGPALLSSPSSSEMNWCSAATRCWLRTLALGSDEPESKVGISALLPSLLSNSYKISVQ